MDRRQQLEAVRLLGLLPDRSRGWPRFQLSPRLQHHSPCAGGTGQSWLSSQLQRRVDVANCHCHTPFQPRHHSRGSHTGFTPVACTCLGKKFTSTTFHGLHYSPGRTRKPCAFHRNTASQLACGHSEIPNSLRSSNDCIKQQEKISCCLKWLLPLILRNNLVLTLMTVL